MVRCIKGDYQRVLVRDYDINERWRTYLDKLFNENAAQELRDLYIQKGQVNREFIRITQRNEVKEALKNIKSKKAVGLDDITVEAWKCLEEEGVECLTRLFNGIIKEDKMPT